jgi:hypothetical protein
MLPILGWKQVLAWPCSKAEVIFFQGENDAIISWFYCFLHSFSFHKIVTNRKATIQLIEKKLRTKMH